jgi:hypothetical protein
MASSGSHMDHVVQVDVLVIEWVAPRVRGG